MLTFEITFSEMRRKFLAAAKGEIVTSARNAGALELFVGKWMRNSGNFYGCRLAETLSYLASGFEVEGLDGINPDAIPRRKRARSRFNDSEGDFRYDLFCSGDDRYYLEFERREVIPGITVEFETGFLADIPAETIAAYARWICQALIAIETSGVDAAIYATATGSRRMTDSDENLQWRMSVKKEGERCDFTEWSALFSPGSYRQLGFFTNILAADANMRRISTGMGASISKGWGVSFDKDSRTLRITHVSTGYPGIRFPEADMTAKLSQALSDAKN